MGMQTKKQKVLIGHSLGIQISFFFCWVLWDNTRMILEMRLNLREFDPLIHTPEHKKINK